MARKDVLIYFKPIEEQYLEMLADAKDYEEAYKKGLISDDQYEQAIKMIDIVKINYERIAYIVFLLNAPNRDSKKTNYNKRNAKLVGALENSSQQAVINENADALKVLRDTLKKAGK